MPAVVPAGLLILLRVWLKDGVTHDEDEDSTIEYQRGTGRAQYTLLLWLPASKTAAPTARNRSRYTST